MSINLFGQLEKIANEISPTRNQILFFVGTLKTKHSTKEIMETILCQTQWANYDIQYFEKIVHSLTRTPPTNFFSSSKSKEVKVWRLNQGYIRTVAENEIALDLDSKEDFERAMGIFNAYELKGNCRTWEGAKGGHVSLFFSESVSTDFRERVRAFFNGDPGQINISLEGKSHQKTGNLVKIVAERKGFNTIGLIEMIFNKEGGIKP